MKTKLFAVLSVAAIAAACTSEGERRPLQRTSMTKSAIVGGTLAADGEYPFVPFIYNEGQGYLCTGTLIDDFVVLTAAHCVEDANEANYVVCGGEDPFGDGCYYLTDAAEVHVHPDWNSSTLANDLGIIVLAEEPASQAAGVEPIEYLAQDPGTVYDEGSTFTAVGFGITSASDQTDPKKRKVDLTMTDIYLDIFEYGDSTKNTCSGDSGGPALKTVGGKTTVSGIL